MDRLFTQSGECLGCSILTEPLLAFLKGGSVLASLTLDRFENLPTQPLNDLTKFFLRHQEQVDPLGSPLLVGNIYLHPAGSLPPA